MPKFALLRQRNFREKGPKDFASRINNIIDNININTIAYARDGFTYKILYTGILLSPKTDQLTNWLIKPKIQTIHKSS